MIDLPPLRVPVIGPVPQVAEPVGAVEGVQVRLGLPFGLRAGVRITQVFPARSACSRKSRNRMLPMPWRR